MLINKSKSNFISSFFINGIYRITLMNWWQQTTKLFAGCGSDQRDRKSKGSSFWFCTKESNYLIFLLKLRLVSCIWFHLYQQQFLLADHSTILVFLFSNMLRQDTN